MEAAKQITVKDPSGLEVPVLLASTLEMAEGFRRDALALEIKDLDSFHKASEILNTIQRFISGLKDQTLALGRPYRDCAAEITKRGTTALDPLEQGKAALSAKASAWHREQERIKREEEARLAAQRLEAERLQAEAVKKVVEAEGTTEAQFDKAGEDLQAAADLKRQADALRPATITKVKGLKTVQRVFIDSVDKKTAPVWALEYNESAIKKAIQAGSVTDSDTWLKFRVIEEVTATGR